jgi:urea transport system permease protein
MTRYLLPFLLWLLAQPAFAALDPALVKQLAAEDSDAKIAALQQLGASATPEAGKVLKAMADDALLLAGETVFMLDGDKAIDAATGEAITPPPEAYESISVNNRVRSALGNALAAMKLFDPDRAVRLAAVIELQSNAGLDLVPILAQAMGKESDAEIKGLLQQAHAQANLTNPDVAARLAAVRALAESASAATRGLLLPLLEPPTSRKRRCATPPDWRSTPSNRVWQWARRWPRCSPACRLAASCYWPLWVLQSPTA